MIPDVNGKGEYMTYHQGQMTGYVPIDYVDGKKVTAKLKPLILTLQKAASNDGVILTVASGFRTNDEQIAERKAHVIDKTKINDLEYLLSADNGLFHPRTAKPGTSNHQSGLAVDFNVTGKPDVYKWMVLKAHAFGWIRTVPSERWHWEYQPGKDVFSVVPKTEPTWDGLV
jgi:LAS superfamily LD-carboxypeptidase LdcB